MKTVTPESLQKIAYLIYLPYRDELLRIYDNHLPASFLGIYFAIPHAVLLECAKSKRLVDHDGTLEFLKLSSMNFVIDVYAGFNSLDQKGIEEGRGLFDVLLNEANLYLRAIREDGDQAWASWSKKSELGQAIHAEIFKPPPPDQMKASLLRALTVQRGFIAITAKSYDVAAREFDGLT